MTDLRNWWQSKSTNQKNNWRVLAMINCMIASGFVESFTWAALIGVFPACVIIYLELTDEKH